MPSAGLNFRYRRAERNIRPFRSDEESLSVKYRCPVFQSFTPESSPSTQTSKKRSSSRSRTRTVSSVTLKMRRVGSGLSGSGSASSSSNGRSNRSLMLRELGEFVLTVTQALDVRRESRFFVGVHDDGV